MKKKFYAVKNGRNKGIFNSWIDCKKQVDKFAGAEFKSFLSIEEAQKYLNNNTKHSDTSNNIAYIDGSFCKNKKLYGSGILLILNETEKNFFFNGNNPIFLSSQNVAGELMACIFVLNYCIKNNINDITIYYDYQGIEKWTTGEWKTNKPISIIYKKYYNYAKNKINVNFKKVKAHSGNSGNEKADYLAKKSLSNGKTINFFNVK